MFRGDRLMALMQQNCLSQSELARRIKVSQATIWKLVNEPMQGTKHLHRIAHELDVSPAYLMDETDEPTPSYQPNGHLTSDERELLNMLESLEQRDRAAIMQIVRSMARVSSKQTLHSPRLDFKGK